MELKPNQTLRIEDIYVPARLRGRINPKTVEDLAASILEKGQLTPILVRPDGDRFVLVEGLHRIEACKALGEKTIIGLVVQARRN
jgi:ParB-like chromosome segregation protein Spo0J